MTGERLPEPPLRGEFETVAETMDAAVEQFGEQEAYVEGDRRVSFAEWLHAADRLAATLADRGVRRGDVVALLLPPSIDYAICYTAVARLGAVSSGVNIRLGPREVAAIFNQSEPVLVIVDDDVVRPPETAVPMLKRSDLVGASTGIGPGRPPGEGRSDDPVVIIWTSGTTGSAKGAGGSITTTWAAVTSARVMTAPFDRRLSATPFAHAGYMAKLWEQLAWGVTLVLAPTPWTVADTVRLLIEERITVAGAVPTQWAKIVDEPGLEGARLPDLRLAVSATALAARARRPHDRAPPVPGRHPVPP